jgi:hypothetical protein
VSESKVCTKCKVTKPLSDFRKCYKSKSGLTSQCRECYNAYMNRYYHSNQEYREYQSALAKAARRNMREEVMTHYSQGQPKCECCGEMEYEFLSVDHIHGNGPEHRRQGIASKRFYKWLKDNGYPEGYRVLCMNCNFATGVHGHCPHQQKRAAEAALFS